MLRRARPKEENKSFEVRLPGSLQTLRLGQLKEQIAAEVGILPAEVALSTDSQFLGASADNKAPGNSKSLAEYGLTDGYSVNLLLPKWIKVEINVILQGDSSGTKGLQLNVAFDSTISDFKNQIESETGRRVRTLLCGNAAVNTDDCLAATSLWRDTMRRRHNGTKILMDQPVRCFLGLELNPTPKKQGGNPSGVGFLGTLSSLRKKQVKLTTTTESGPRGPALDDWSGTTQSHIISGGIITSAAEEGKTSPGGCPEDSIISVAPENHSDSASSTSGILPESLCDINSGATSTTPTRVLIFGCMGDGKSETGITISGTVLRGGGKLLAGSSPSSVTKEIAMEAFRYDASGVSRPFELFDTPGWFDPSMRSEEVKAQMKRFPSMAPEGIDVFLFVVNLSSRLQQKHLYAWQSFLNEFPGAAQHTMLAFTNVGNIGMDRFFFLECLWSVSPKAIVNTKALCQRCCGISIVTLLPKRKDPAKCWVEK